MKYIVCNVLYERIDNIGYIVKEVDGIPDLNSMITLNEVASDIWEYLNIAHSFEEIVEYISNLYDADKMNITDDINEILAAMLDQRIICEK